MANDDVSGCMAFFVCQRHPAVKSKARLGLQYHAGGGDQTELPPEAQRVAFCFPVATEMHETRRVAAPEEFTYTMTGDRGERSHGFCRKIYYSPSYKIPKFPVVLCIVSNDLWPIFHFKVLEVMQELLVQERLLGTEPQLEMPKSCAAAKFLDSVNRRLRSASAPGSVITVHYPEAPDFIQIQAPQKINAMDSQMEPLKSTPEFIELQVPPLTGRSPAMAGVSLARLLWRIPVKCLMTLIASLLLERRIIMVCRSRDTLSAAIHAASALIYPFEWSHRFYLPIMPESMRHFLQAPFPFLVGLPAELMEFKGLEMDEVTLIDLDLGTCRPEPDSENDDAGFLPKKKKLEEALHAAVKALRSPTEFEGNFRIAEIMTGYIVSLFKNYRQFISRKEEVMNKTTPRGSPGSRFHSRFRFLRNGVPLSRPQSEATLDLFSSRNNEVDRAGIDGHGFYFDHSRFVASHRSKTERAFLELFRQSQMYEVFIQQRLEMASLGIYPKDDSFEYKINLISEHSKKLEPGEEVGRTWTRRLSFRPIPQKIQAVAEATMRKSRTLVQGDPAVLQLEALQKTPLLVDNPATLATASKRRLGGLKGRDRRISKAQSIKNIVTDMARESSRRLSKPEPGNFLQRSRASLVERNMDYVPEESTSGTPGAAAVTEPTSFLSSKEDDETESSEESEILPAAQVRERTIGASPSSFKAQSSPWLDTPEQNIFDAWNSSGRLSLDDSVFNSSTNSSFRYESRMSLKTESTGVQESLQNTLLRVRSEEMIATGSPEEEGQECASADASAMAGESKSKPNQVDAFLESNLKEFSQTHSVKWGLPPKPQRNGVSESLAFPRR